MSAALDFSRYARQMAVREFGERTQAKLAASTVAIIGCGALGSIQGELLTRMGIGSLRIADGDHVTLHNIHRQLLFTEQDAAEATKKVAVAGRRFPSLNATLKLHTLAERITAGNISDFVGNADLVLDATDHIPTRFLINDWCVRKGIPWIYTGVSATSGLILPVVQGGPCLQCLYPEPPVETEAAHPNQSGVLPTTVLFAASLQVTQALRILNGTLHPGNLLQINVWNATCRTTRIRKHPDCPCCGNHENLSADRQ